MKDKILEIMIEKASLLNTLLACFYMDGYDEIIPNEKWGELSEEERKKVREYFRGIE